MADVTFTVTVSGSKFYLGSQQNPAISLDEGKTYRFDQSDSSNSGHTLAFKNKPSGSAWTTGVTTSGTAGSASAYTEWAVAAGYIPEYWSGIQGVADSSQANHALNFLYYSAAGGESYGNTIHVGSSGDSDTYNPLPATGSAISASDVAGLQGKSLSNVTFSSLQSDRHSEDGGAIGNTNVDLSDTFGGTSSRS
jgi:hypothetical protein